MRNIFAIAVFAGFGWLGLSSSLQAATLTQDFEIVVDRNFPEDAPSTRVPPLGTRGQGRLTFDTDQIKLQQLDQYYDPYRVGYIVRQPTSLLINFFNQQYTNLPVTSSFPRLGPYFEFSRTQTGGYQFSGFAFGTTDATPNQSALSMNGDFFAYAPGAYGTVSLTPAEAIPEPTTIAGVPIAIALSWAFHHRFKRQVKKR